MSVLQCSSKQKKKQLRGCVHIPLAAKRRTIPADMVAEGEDSAVSNSKDGFPLQDVEVTGEVLSLQ